MCTPFCQRAEAISLGSPGRLAIRSFSANAGNGIVRARNVWEADLALQKSTKLGEKAALEFRAEAFNIFNHRQLGDPSHLDILSTSNFGQIDTPVSFNTNNDNFVEPATGLGLPRTLQLSFRVRF
jgi:hypothetical protein